MVAPRSEKQHERLRETRQTWDHAAAAFDEAPDHGLRDPAVRDAWTRLLKLHIPPAPAAVLDIGCGTGSLSSILAALGHRVTAVDISPAMLALARAKALAQGHAIDFGIMDAAFPGFAARHFDAILCRHLLWALPAPARVLQRWSRLLKGPGCLCLIEGYWTTGAGLHAGQITSMLPATFSRVAVRDLTTDLALWDGQVTDERYFLRVDF